MKNVFALLLVMVFMSGNASAISLVFKFDVNSSGPSIYACNAGIKHKKSNPRICYNRETLAQCNPNLCEEGEACNCVCTGNVLTPATEGGEWKYDFLAAISADWTDNEELIGDTTKHNVRANNSSNFSTIFDSDVDAFEKQLTHLEFNLSSERYGAEYFLDVCYRGPQIDFFGASELGYPDFDYLAYGIETQVTVTDLTNGDGPKYQDVSDLAVSAEIICDIQGSGSHQGGGDNSITFESDYTKSLITNQLFSTNGDVVNGNKKTLLGPENAPRFCKVRYFFKESNTDMRKWKKQKARVCTTTVVDENEDSVL